MATVRINTSDVAWIERHPHGTGGDLVAYGKDIRGVMYFTTPAVVPEVEHIKFAGAAMIRFDLGPDAPRDHNRWAMYPETYLISEEG
jgi:hypothetical protein